MKAFSRRTMLVLPLVAALWGLMPNPAAADTIFDLSNPNAAISPYPGPYAKVDVNLTSSTTATITFTSYTNSGNIYLMGDGSTVALNVNSASFSVSGVSGSNGGTGFTPGPYTVQNPPGTSNVDGFGRFNLTIDSFDGFTHSSDSVTLTVTNLSGTWAGSADVLTPNADGSTAAAHIFVTSSPANASNGALATGYAANGNQVIPEPSSIVLGLVGLMGLGLTQIRRLVRRNPLALA
jgi:hypothetical protein